MVRYFDLLVLFLILLDIIVSFRYGKLNGTKGKVYGRFKEYMLVISIISSIKDMDSPNSPYIDDNISEKNLQERRLDVNSGLLNIILVINVKDIIIIIIGLTMLAFTAASPMISAPNIDIAEP